MSDTTKRVTMTCVEKVKLLDWLRVDAESKRRLPDRVLAERASAEIPGGFVYCASNVNTIRNSAGLGRKYADKKPAGLSVEKLAADVLVLANCVADLARAYAGSNVADCMPANVALNAADEVRAGLMAAKAGVAC
jgi:hypothetical protein